MLSARSSSAMKSTRFGGGPSAAEAAAALTAAVPRNRRRVSAMAGLQEYAHPERGGIEPWSSVSHIAVAAGSFDGLAGTRRSLCRFYRNPAFNLPPRTDVFAVGGNSIES